MSDERPPVDIQAMTDEGIYNYLAFLRDDEDRERDALAHMGVETTAAHYAAWEVIAAIGQERIRCYKELGDREEDIPF